MTSSNQMNFSAYSFYFIIDFQAFNVFSYSPPLVRNPRVRSFLVLSGSQYCNLFFLVGDKKVLGSKMSSDGRYKVGSRTRIWQQNGGGCWVLMDRKSDRVAVRRGEWISREKMGSQLRRKSKIKLSHMVSLTFFTNQTPISSFPHLTHLLQAPPMLTPPSSSSLPSSHILAIHSRSLSTTAPSILRIVVNSIVMPSTRLLTPLRT